MSNLQKSKKDLKIGVVVTLVYFIVWLGCTMIPVRVRGLLNLPLYFELTAIYLPIVFIVVICFLLLPKKDSKLINDDY